MQLAFSSLFADKTATNFDYKIIVGEKTHSFREGERWRPGMSIQMYVHARTPNSFQFNKDRPHLEKCTATQPWAFVFGEQGQLQLLIGAEMGAELRLVGPDQLELIARNDGFNSAEAFLNYFLPRVVQAPIDAKVGSLTYGRQALKGQIVHWTDTRY